MKRKLFAMITFLSLLGLVSVWAAAATPIHILTYGAGTTFDRWERVAAAFHEDRPEYTLDVEIVSFDEYPTKVSLMLASGIPPDVFMTWAQYKEQWALAGMLTDLTPYWEKSEMAQQASIFPFIMDAALYDDMILGVPYDFSSMAIILNVDGLNEAGLDIPDRNWTTDDYRDYAIRLTRPERGIYGTNQQGTPNADNWTWSVNFTGEGWLNADRTKVLINRQPYLNMLDYWLDLVNIGASPRPGVAPTGGNLWTGGFGMWAGWSHWAGRFQTEATYDWAMVPFPVGPAGGASFAHAHMWSLPSNASDPDLGWVFLEWLLSPEGQHAMVTIDGRQPLSNDPELWDAFVSVVEPEKQGMIRSLFIDTLYGQSRIHTMEYWNSWNDVDGVVRMHLGNVFRGQIAPAAAMEQAARQVEAILAASN